MVNIEICEDFIDLRQASFIRRRADVVLCPDLQPIRDEGKIDWVLM